MEISVFIYNISYIFGLFNLVLTFNSVSSDLFHRRKYRTIEVARSYQRVEVYQGYTALLKCSIENLGPRSVAWRKVTDDFPLSIGKMIYAPNEEMSIDYQETGHVTHINLVIKRTKPSHAGTYECQLIGSEAKLHHVTLKVIAEPPIPTKSISLDGSVYLSPKQRLNLTCSATGTMRAPEYIDWFHNGDLIDVKKVQWRNRVAFFNRIPETPGRSLISQLTIEHATTEDAGVYVCRSVTASTDSDVETTSITVHILNAEKDHFNKREDESSLTQPQEQDRTTRDKGAMRYGYFNLIFVMVWIALIIS